MENKQTHDFLFFIRRQLSWLLPFTIGALNDDLKSLIYSLDKLLLKLNSLGAPHVGGTQKLLTLSHNAPLCNSAITTLA
jgi:hypothetical protein